MLQCRRPRWQKVRSLLELGVKFLISYFLGSAMGALIIGRVRGGVDIRTMGSGNAGGTNALRTQGILFAVAVVIIDVGKGAVAAGVVPLLDIPFVGLDPTISRTWLTICCASAAVFGHVWPFYHGFRGGKGAATYVGTFTILGPTLIIPIVIVWALVVMLSGYVGLATMTAAIAVPVWLAATRLPADQALFIYSAAMAGFIIYWHRSNIQRMRLGEELRNTNLMFLRRKDRVIDDR
jgi:glycerol-3-phosphate acyltransferase PlsY